MIKINRLSIEDSFKCIEFKENNLKRLNPNLYEIRRSNFFKFYQVYSNDFYSYGAFSNSNLVGLCSFIKLPEYKNSYWVADFLTEKAYTSELIPNKFFQEFKNDLNLNLQKDPLTIFALEANYLHLSPLDKILSRYHLKATHSQVLFTSIVKVQTPKTKYPETKIESIKNDLRLPVPLKESILSIDQNAQVFTVGGLKYIAFTDADFRNYIHHGQLIKRLYIAHESKSDIPTEDMNELLEIAFSIAVLRGIDYAVFTTSEKTPFSCDAVYVNRLLTFKNREEAHMDYCYNKGIIL